MEKLVGQTLNRYKLVKLLGEGGMGAVFKGFDLTLQRDVAIKIMHPHFARTPNFQERFLQEARTAARLDHPGVVKVFDFGHSQSQLYIVMEFIPGDNLGKMLRDLKKEGKWIVLPEAIEIIRQVSLALDYAHKQGVLHRDIKPDNIMLKPRKTEVLPYTPVVTDLGLAKLAGSAVVTQEGVSMGTPAYMAPEQALGDPTDERSDVYSLGVLLFELATGKLPFPAKTLTEAIRYHTKEEPPAPRSIRSDLPEELEKIILKAMAKEPDQRFNDSGNLADALKNVLSPSKEEAYQPTSVEGAVSLVTQYQQSLVEKRGDSILEEFAPPSDLSQDKIQVMSEGSPTASYNIDKAGMTIGRSADCQIVITDPQASRSHAKIEFRDGNYHVLDLNSTNGTYLDNARLLPGISEVWTPDKALRIGDTWFRLLTADATSRPPAVSGMQPMRSFRQATSVDPNMVLSSPGQGKVGVYMENSNLSTEAGGVTTVSLVLLNQGAVVDHFHIVISGMPQEWIPNKPKPVQLMPGEQQPVTITIQVPRQAESRAGKYNISFRVYSQSVPDQTVEVKGSLTVGVFSSFNADFYPKKIRTGQTARLTVNNRGNARETYNVAFRDRADELIFNPALTQVTVQENQSSAIQFQARPRKRRLIGGSLTHSFNAEVSSPQGDKQTVSGEAISRGLIPPWMIPILIGLVVLACVALAFLGNNYIKSNQVKTQIAMESIQMMTDTAVGAMQAAILGTQNSNATATVLAQTAEAVGDNDGDGISNIDELTVYRTDPNNPDTDNDGLSDGSEINQYGTNPKLADTDGDTLSDGDEVNNLNTNPREKDTDSDGLNDNIDPDPGHPPTTTPTPTATTTNTPTPTATDTPMPGTIEDFVGSWVNVEENTTGLRSLNISKINNNNVSYHAYEKCSPEDCDWSAMAGGDVTVPFTPPKLTGTYNFGYKTIQISVERFGDRLNVEVIDSSDGQTKYYTMKQAFRILRFYTRVPFYLLPSSTPTP
jgi:serine/threonine protein kinase